MAQFQYAGLDRNGRKVSGALEGSSRRTVSLKLRSQGIYPTELHEASRSSSRLSFARLRLSRQLPLADLAAATRQLATLLGAGLPLDETLATVSEQSDHSLIRQAFAGVREHVVQGKSLHQGLARQQRLFPELYLNMAQVGEESGTLDQALHRLADFLESRARNRARIQAALAYPALMSLVGSGVLIFLFTFVVPKITQMLTELERALPLPTLLLIGMTDLLSRWWWLLALALGLGLFMLHRYRSTEKGRMHTDRLLLSTPLLGRLQLHIVTAQFSRTIGTLLQSGIPLLKALEIAGNLIGNRVLRDAIDSAARQLQEGGSLALALRQSGVFPPMLAQLTAAGEKSGQLEEMLLRLADSYEHQTELTISAMLALLEPLMILLMGAIVGFVVLAMLLPIFEASQGFA